MKKVLLCLVAMMVVATAISQTQNYYDFSAITPSGHTLYYVIVNGEVEIVREYVEYPGYQNLPVGDLIIPSSVTNPHNGITYTVSTIGLYAFSQCMDLTSVTIPNSVTNIREQAFSACSGLKSVTIPNSVISIEQQAFQLSGLTSVTIPNSVTDIGSYAFATCDSLTSVLISTSVTSISLEAFAFCENLSSIIVSEGNPIYDSRDNCNAIIETATNTLVAGCKNTIIPNSVTSIVAAFAGCSGLTSIMIPNSVTNIGYRAFYGCNNLNEIISHAAVAPLLDGNAFYVVPITATVRIPCNSTASYTSTWTNFSNYIEQIPFILSVMTTDENMGIVNIETEPTCETPTVVSATANYGYSFDHWSDGNTDNPRTLTVTQDTTLEALFEIATYSVTVGNALGSGTYTHGSTAVLAALPQVDLQFAGWSDGETANPRYIVVTSDTTLEALYRTPDTVRVYDTTTVYDTVINIVYDTTEYNHYFYDTTRVYDTLVVLDTTIIYDTLIVRDTTTVYDTVVYMNVDTLHHYYYDTTRIFDTMIYVNIDTLNHYFYDTTNVYDTLILLDTTRIYDTMVYVNIDTLHHYYYDTTRVFDTLVNLDTVHHYIFDSTMVYDTMIYVHIDTLHHYQYDTTYTVDTLFFFDTTSMTHYVFDSTWVFDSVWVYDTVYVLDTVYFFDTVYIQVPVQGIDGVEMVNVKVYTYSTQIIVEGAQGMAVRLYDVNGRLLATKMEDAPITYFYVQTSGTYLVRVGEHPARRVVVIR